VILEGKRPAPVQPEHWHTTTSSLLWSVVTVVGSVALGYASLYRARLPHTVSDGLGRLLQPLRAAHSGHIGDYVAWLTFGTTVIGAAFAISFR
jgi:multicomponent Na+:H+ antiporter subunit D